MYNLLSMMNDNILKDQEGMRTSKKISQDLLMNKNFAELSRFHMLFQV